MLPHLPTKLRWAIFFGTGTRLFLSGFIMLKQMFMQILGAVTVFCYEHSSVYSFVIF